MNSGKLSRYRDTLLALRSRVAGEVNHVVEAIHEEVDLSHELSSAPVHLADVASSAVDADVHVLQTERGILGEIDAALERIADGSFGACETCSGEIAAERLEALPYASRCTECARAEE